MEPPKNDPPRLPDMVMCGDHPSITKTELNAKEPAPPPIADDKPPEKDKKERMHIMSYAGLSPSTSRTERPAAEQKSRATSEHALRLSEARRRARELDVVSRHDDISAPGNRALVQAALGSFRWPPYLVAVWVLVLLLTHVLHCLVTVLERALPAARKFCQYFRTWTEESWKTETEVNHRLYPLGLACVTGLLYALYFGFYAIYAVALWSIEPLYAEDEKREDVETKVTNYVDEVQSKTNSSVNK